jgi:acid phosphatase
MRGHVFVDTKSERKADFPFKMFISLIATASAFILEQHTNQLTFYHRGQENGIPTEIPENCVVDQLHSVTRHGTRYPSRNSYNALVAFETLAKTFDYTNAPKEFQFLKDWKLSDMIPDPVRNPENMTVLGLNEMRAFGKQMRTEYPQLFAKDMTVWSGSVERVQLSAKAFMEGYFGSVIPNQFVVVNQTETDSANSLQTVNTCLKMTPFPDVTNNAFGKQWFANMTARFAKWWPEFKVTDYGAVLDLCIYERNFVGTDRFCALFTEDDWYSYDYGKDTSAHRSNVGYNSSFSATLGYPWLAATTKLLQKDTCQKYFPLFAHENLVLLAIRSLGLFFDQFEQFPPTLKLDRKYRISNMTPMGGRALLERLNCNGKRFVRVKVNERVQKIPGCDSGPGFACPLDQFVERVEARKSTDGNFIEKCSLQNLTNATNDLLIFNDKLKQTCLPPTTSSTVPTSSSTLSPSATGHYATVHPSVTHYPTVPVPAKDYDIVSSAIHATISLLSIYTIGISLIL